MTLINKTIQYVGMLDGEKFYYDLSQHHLLLSSKNTNSAWTVMLAPITATVSGGILNFLGSQIIIAQFIWRLMLLIGLSVLMHLLASFVSQLIIKKTNFQEVTLSEDRLKLLIKKTKFQIICLHIINFFFWIGSLGLAIALLSNSRMTFLFIFSFILFTKELLRMSVSPSKRKKILNLLTQKLDAH